MYKILSLAIFILFLLWSYLYIHTFVYPHTYLGQINVSGLSKKQLSDLINKSTHTPFKMNVKDRQYEYRYRDIGVGFNEQKIVTEVFAPNYQSFPLNIIAFFQALSSQRMVLPQAQFTDDFNRYISATTFNFSEVKNSVAIDNTNKELLFEDKDDSYTIEPAHFKQQITATFGTNKTLTPPLVKIENNMKDIVSSYNERIQQTYEKPISVTVKDGNNSNTVSISETDVKKMIAINYLPQQNQFGIMLDENIFQNMMNQYLGQFSNGDKKVYLNQVKTDFVSLLNARAGGQEVDSIETEINLAPNTNGDKAVKYIEVDISQQRMYLFANGQPYATYGISSGFYNPTPRGEFKILNKAVNAYSDIYDVWMPYWMAFYHDPKLNAYFGLHELPYKLTSDGQKIQRPRSFIGSPHTGGCVALDIGAAKEVYMFADVGMPVYVFN